MLFINNLEEQNKKALSTLVKVASVTLDRIINSNDANDILVKPKTAVELDKFNSDMDDILLARLRNKFKL